MPQMGPALEIICLPSPDSESSRHTPDQPDGEKQAGGMVLSSAWTSLHSISDDSHVSGAFQRAIKKKVPHKLGCSQTELQCVRLRVS